MDKHTPGPWTYDGSHIYASDGAIIAQVHNPGSRASDYPLEANRNVMAAAPELLEALAAYDEAFGNRGPYINTDPDHLAMVAKARAAIAKATSP